MCGSDSPSELGNTERRTTQILLTRCHNIDRILIFGITVHCTDIHHKLKKKIYIYEEIIYSFVTRLFIKKEKNTIELRFDKI
jgi:hypothetical protein